MSEGALDRAARALAFGLHIPFAKLARRVELGARRTIRDRLPYAEWRTNGAPPRVGTPPHPLFAPRPCALAVRTFGTCFTFLGRTVSMPGPGIDWTAPGPGAENQLWRMHLHDMTYLESVPDPLWCALVTDWIDANSPSRPGAWRDAWNSYALSIRTVVWMQELARRAGRLPAAVVAKAEHSLDEQLRFLERNLETDIGGNHLIKNAKALLWASCYFSGSAAARWRNIARDVLRREIPVQVLADGMHYERSASYHADVHSDLLECRHALAQDPLQGRLDDALHRMAQATADLAHPDGRATLFNDAGLTMARAPGDVLDAHARIFGSRPEPRTVFSFENAGYFGLHAPQSYFVIDCGRIAPDDLVAHGHGDVLSFEWSAGGKRLIVDPGVFAYAAGERRRRARAAASHNTLAFDGADMADFFGAFRCGRRPDVTVLDYRRTANGFVLEGTHDGFGHLPGAPRHIRRVEASSHRIAIHDRIEGASDRPARIGFLLHPDVRLEENGEGFAMARDGVAATIAASRPLAVEGAVWWPDLGHEQPTKRLRITLMPGECETVTVLSMKDPGR